MDFSKEDVRAEARVLEGDLARERGKDLLRRGDFQAARQALADASRAIGGWKVHSARVGLYLAPQLVRRLYLSRFATTPR